MVKLQEIHAIVTRISFPASKEEILDYVRKEGYPDEIRQRLETLPEYRYGSANSVMDALRDLD